MELVFDYMRDDILRHRLNDLTRKVFNFDFEDWVTGGYFEGDYIPYSFMEDGKILANVSANRMHFLQNGVPRTYIQIGTVMTDEAFRGQGLAGTLVEHILKEYEGACDGFYLFSNASALGFYRKLGFLEGVQYQYSLKKNWPGGVKKTGGFKKVDGRDRQMRLKYEDAVRHCAVQSALEQTNKFGLQMFYTADMCDVYCAEEIDCFAVMEASGDALTLKSVISRQPIALEVVISHIGAGYRELKLGFPPLAGDAHLFDVSVYDDGGDDRLFYLGKKLESIEKEKLYFPALSHA